QWRAGAEAGVGAADCRGGASTLRSGGGTVGARTADPGERRRACAADHHAPHRVGWMVDWRADGGIERALRGVRERGIRPVAGTADSVCRLRDMATTVV